MTEITKCKMINKGPLVAIFSIKVPKWGNFLINDLTYFKKGSQEWISFPSKEYMKDNEKKYFQLCLFEDKEMGKKFQDIVIPLLKQYIIDKNLDLPKIEEFTEF